MQSDGQSSSNPDDLIDLHIPAGSVYLDVVTQGGAGTYTLTTTLAPANPQFQPIPVVSNPAAIVAGDFAGDGRTDLAVALYTYDSPCIVSVLMGNGDGTFQPGVQYAVGSGPSTSASRLDGRATSPATDTSTWPSRTLDDSTVSVLLGNGDGTFQPQVTFATVRSKLPRGRGFQRRRTDRPGRPRGHGISVLLSNGDGTFQRRRTIAAGSNHCPWSPADFNGDGKLDLAVADRSARSRHGRCHRTARQRRRHVPARRHLRRPGRSVVNRRRVI